MPNHDARFPGVANDPTGHVLTARQAARLAALAPVPAPTLAGKPLAEVTDRLKPFVPARLLMFRKICGRVVKTDASGNDLPVPFATVTVYDTDFNFLAWSPSDSPFSWFYPFHVRREKLATVTTDECGRFCVWVPRLDIDHYLRWRRERRCYLSWLRRPTVEDLLRAREIIPELRPELRPDAGPVRPVQLDEHVLTHAARVLDESAIARLREAAATVRPGPVPTRPDESLTRAAFPRKVPPPMSAAAAGMLAPNLRPGLAARIGVPVAALAKLDPRRVHGPFLRCRDLLVPQWTLVVDVPDLSFEVTQDVNGDGQQEVICSEGLFDVRWDTNIADVTLHADASALAGVSCDVPEIGACGEPAILFAGNYPLQVGTNPSEYHDGATGFALLPNRPDQNGVPGEGARIEPANAPFVGSFYLVGCAERPGATHYRVHHKVGGITSFLSGSYGPLMKVVGSVLQQRVISPVDGQWYPIVQRSEGWTPVGILAPVHQGGDELHSFHLEFGKATAGGPIAAIPGSETPPVRMQIDATPPLVEFLAMEWRHPGVSLAWQPLPVGDCAVVAREGGARVQFHLKVRISASHLRNFSVSAGGCGPGVAPQLITDGRNGLPIAAADAAAHWHTGPSDNTLVRDVYYELPAGAPAGCYRFSVFAATRSFNPTAVISDPNPAMGWRIDTAPVYVHPTISVALQ